uniref:Rhodanese domain-containing protein n=1 Tax=Oncorhynchus tshawytscha TaxID=74940 RepID=A0A8C8FR84_ONCTS
MSTKSSIGNTEYMKRRIPQNPKYQHVRTRLDTGCSLTKYVERLEEIKKNYRYRKDELFKRLKVTTFAQLPDTFDSHYSVISGVGELDLDKNGQKTVTLTTVSSPRLPDGPYPDCPYLLLDVRDREQYDQCHIISAYSYPIATLSRTMNPYTKEVLDYKNVSGKIIIVYDEDERIAAQAATAMCERGFQNLFMLSGGLKVIAQKFPEGMTTGTIPASCLPSPKVTAGRKRYTHRQVFMPADRKWRFTSDDMANIQAHLEEMLVPSDTNSRFSSRMSTSSAQSKASSARSLHTSSLAGSETARSQSSRPWK